MSLTLFFIILSLAIGYLLYDSFRKSRQKSPQTPLNPNNKLKINYTHECSVLNTLSKEKLSSIKTKTISIHLNHNDSPAELTDKNIEEIRKVLSEVLETRRIYFIVKVPEGNNKLVKLLKELVGRDFVIPYTSTQGAVAILRQISSGLHLEGEKQLYLKIKQYLNKIWYVGQDPEEQALREFPTQTEMLLLLANLQTFSQEEA